MRLGKTSTDDRTSGGWKTAPLTAIGWGLAGLPKGPAAQLQPLGPMDMSSPVLLGARCLNRYTNLGEIASDGKLDRAALRSLETYFDPATERRRIARAGDRLEGVLIDADSNGIGEDRLYAALDQASCVLQNYRSGASMSPEGKRLANLRSQLSYSLISGLDDPKKLYVTGRDLVRRLVENPGFIGQESRARLEGMREEWKHARDQLAGSQSSTDFLMLTLGDAIIGKEDLTGDSLSSAEDSEKLIYMTQKVWCDRVAWTNSKAQLFHFVQALQVHNRIIDQYPLGGVGAHSGCRETMPGIENCYMHLVTQVNARLIQAIEAAEHQFKKSREYHPRLVEMVGTATHELKKSLLLATERVVLGIGEPESLLTDLTRPKRPLGNAYNLLGADREPEFDYSDNQLETDKDLIYTDPLVSDFDETAARAPIAVKPKFENGYLSYPEFREEFINGQRSGTNVASILAHETRRRLAAQTLAEYLRDRDFNTNEFTGVADGTADDTAQRVWPADRDLDAAEYQQSEKDVIKALLKGESRAALEEKIFDELLPREFADERSRLDLWKHQGKDLLFVEGMRHRNLVPGGREKFREMHALLEANRRLEQLATEDPKGHKNVYLVDMPIVAWTELPTAAEIGGPILSNA